MAAAAAAAAVWSRSIRIFGNHRMRRVNSEWDAALRWIAGWDSGRGQGGSRDSSMPPAPPLADDGGRRQRQQQQQPSKGSGKGGGDSGGDEGFDAFVDDLARMLEACISQCVEDEGFEARLEREAGGGDDGQRVAAPSFLAGDLVLRSLLGWIARSALSRLAPESKSVLASTARLAVSSAAAYALRSLWTWASPAAVRWYSSLGRDESPEWLVEHEREVEVASSAKKRGQKKKARRRPAAAARQAGGRGKPVHGSEAPGAKGSSREGGANPDRSVSPDAASLDPEEKESRRKLSFVSSSDMTRNERKHSGEWLQVSKDSASGSQEGSSVSGGIPTSISYASTSASSSPSVKPIGSHLEDRDVHFGLLLPKVASQPVTGLNPTPQGSLFSQRHVNKPFPVPTQEQRNEAAAMLREYQNAQIQRLLLQRRLKQGSSGSGLSATTATTSTTTASEAQSPVLLLGNSLHAATQNSSTISLGEQGSKVLKPPPGFVLSSVAQACDSTGHNHDDKGFLTENELFLTKLLDDEDEDERAEVQSSLFAGMSVSLESSLDPSAAPFVGKVDSRQLEKQKAGDGDAWKAGAGDLLLKDSPAKAIKGVYGGSVW